MFSFERFPILYSYDERREAARCGWPVSVPLALLASHEEQAKRNHSQSLQTLAERGGLSPKEILAVVLDQAYRSVESMTTDEALTQLLSFRKVRM
jgi:hypothetical protein